MNTLTTVFLLDPLLLTVQVLNLVPSVNFLPYCLPSAAGEWLFFELAPNSFKLQLLYTKIALIKQWFYRK